MLEMAGLTARPSQHVDGVSFGALVRGNSQILRRDALYWHYPHYHVSGHRPSGAVRSGDLKLIEFYEDMNVELYDLRNDPSEREDLSARFPDREEKLRAMLHEWRRQVGASMPERA